MNSAIFPFNEYDTGRCHWRAVVFRRSNLSNLSKQID